MDEHGGIINIREYEDTKSPKEGGTSLGPLGTLGGNAPKMREVTYKDGTVAQEHLDPASGEWKQVSIKVPQSVANAALKPKEAPKPVKGPDGRLYTVDEATNTLVPLQGQGAGVDPTAPKPGTVPEQERADALASKNDHLNAYYDAEAAWKRGEINGTNLPQQVQAYNQRLQTQVALGQITESQRQNMLKEWQAGVEAAQAAQRIAIEQQNAATSAGNLGVNRGQLGVSQENADTQRESVIQSAAQNAVTNTMKLLDRFMPVGPGYAANFAKGLSTLSGGGGQVNFAPEDFVGQMPDLHEIARQASAEAVARMKAGFGGPAPATAAAINATAPPAAPAPAPVPSQPALPPSMPAQQILANAGPPPTMPNTATAPLPPYTGPVGSANVQ